MMRRSIFLLTTLLFVSCGSGGGFNIVSLEEEWQLGQQLARDIERQMPMVNDPQVTSYIEQIGRRIVAQTEMANMPWQFHVVQNNEVNAFAIPGGHVYVHTGLINAADNASELAGVMAHEISHGVARHSTEQRSRQYGLSVLAGFALGQNPSGYQELLAQLIGTGTLARFSRDAEREADRLGVRYMHAAGYDPRGMPSMFEKLLARRQNQPGAVERFFSTHPVTEDRIRDTMNQANSMSRSGNLITDEPAFQSVKRRV